MTDNEIIKARDILAKLDFFGGQRAGRELWNEKPVDVQNEDIENFTKDIAFLKEFINRQKAEIERLNLENSQMIASIKGLKKLYETYPDDEEASALYLIRQINEIVKKMKGNNDE
jgi:hypothetical protein